MSRWRLSLQLRYRNGQKGGGDIFVYDMSEETDKIRKGQNIYTYIPETAQCSCKQEDSYISTLF